MKRIFLLIAFTVIALVIHNACTTGKKEKLEYSAEEKEMLAIGKQAAEASFAVLSTQLKEALARGGVPEAIPYCKNVATSITDSISAAYGFSISRTASRVRNPENKADKIDELILSTMENRLLSGQNLEPILISLEERGEKRAYYPITLKPMCKSCHGIVSKEISDEHYALILKEYPEDAAVNFFDASLRGAWKVVFKESSKTETKG